MTINGYLTRLANAAIIRDLEAASIRRSVSALEARLSSYFAQEISEFQIFGSYSRGTILPRHMDPQSDVDCLIVFGDSDKQPQTYLDRLRRFAEHKYEQSDIAQSHPTVALELNHIRFELVPAIQHWWSGLQIPGRSFGYQTWQDTDPVAFNAQLTKANQEYGNLVKPLCRLLKYWNATARYPFESFELEQMVAGQSYGFFGLLSTHRLDQYFYEAVETLDVGWGAAQWRQDAVGRLQQLASDTKSFEESGRSARAESAIKRLLPPVGGLLGAVL